jgi:hypothetical protein
MSNAFSLFRALIIYGLCLPLALFVGYLLATPTDLTSLVPVAIVLCLMTVPLFMRWHYPWLLACWNGTALLAFLPGKPTFTMALCVISLTISLVSYILNRNLKFSSAPSITRPLIFLVMVVLVTAQLNGGIGLNIFGASSVGGKRYIILLTSIIGYFALTARHIPKDKVNLYTNIFFLGGLTAAVGTLFTLINPAFDFIFLIFPPEIIGTASQDLATNPSITRLGGLSVATVFMVYLILARFGILNLLNAKKPWRFLAFILMFVATLFGGYRSRVIEMGLVCLLVFYLEGLMRSRLMPAMILITILGGAMVLPFADQMPLSVQRSLTFLPIKLDEGAEMSSQASTEWRLEMWSEVLPLVPQYLLLGKGLSMDANELNMMQSKMNRGEEGFFGAIMSGDYHSGPLSTVIPFGIWGVISLLWLLGAIGHVLYRNYHYGDPDLKYLNRFFFAYFIVKVIIFFFVFGSFYSDQFVFLGIVGMSVAINGGVLSPVTKPVVRQQFNRFRMAPATR